MKPRFHGRTLAGTRGGRVPRMNRPVAAGAACVASGKPGCRQARSRVRRAYTLIELLVVVAIIGIIMTIAIPSFYRQLHPDSIQRAVQDLVEACNQARAQAILNDTVMEVQIRPIDRTIRIASAGRPSTSSLFSTDLSGEAWRMKDTGEGAGASHAIPSGGASSFSAKISELLNIDLLDVNFLEYKDQDLAQVRFYPNGTSDEFTIILTGDNSEWRLVRLEVVTGLAEFFTDPHDPRVKHLLD